MRKNLYIVTNGSLPREGSSFYIPNWEKEFFEGLQNHFDTITIVTDSTNHRDGMPYTAFQNSASLTFVEISNSKHTKLVRYLASISKVWAIATRIQDNVDCTYIFYPGRNGFLLSLILNVLRKPYWLYIRGSVKTSGIIGRLHNWIVCNSQGNIVTGSFLLDQIKLINKRSELVSPMMNVSKSDLQETHEGAPVYPPTLLFVGQPIEAKGVDTFVNTIRALIDRGHNIKGKIIGNASEAQLTWLNHLINASGVPSNIEVIAGASPTEVRAQMRASSIFVFPTKYAEGFPRVIYEALSLGLPVITTDREMFTHVLQDGLNALLCEVDNIDAFASAAESLLKSKAAHQKLREAGFQTMRGIFAALPDHDHSTQVAKLVHAHNRKR